MVEKNKARKSAAGKERKGALYGEVQKSEDKLGALKREIIGECVGSTS